MDNIKEMKKRARELCKENARVNAYQIKDRKEAIIRKLIKEFDISWEDAEYVFLTNNEP